MEDDDGDEKSSSAGDIENITISKVNGKINRRAGGGGEGEAMGGELISV